MIHAVEAPVAPPLQELLEATGSDNPKRRRRSSLEEKKHTQEAGIISLDWPLLTRSTAGAVKPPEPRPDPPASVTRFCRSYIRGTRMSMSFS